MHDSLTGPVRLSPVSYPAGYAGRPARRRYGVDDAFMHTWGVSQKYPVLFTWNNHCL